jgi:hypothetical protein
MMYQAPPGVEPDAKRPAYGSAAGNPSHYGGAGACYNCGQPGHQKRDCPTGQGSPTGSANTWLGQQKMMGYQGQQGGAARPQSYHKSVRMCKYGMGCTRAECWFQHPEGWTPELAIASVVEQVVYLDAEDIPKIIGSGGNTIKQLCTQSGVKAHVNKEEDGRAMLDPNGKASITLHGPDTGCTRFKAMVTAKIAESKLRAAGQWTEAMQMQQDELIGGTNRQKPGMQYQSAGTQQHVTNYQAQQHGGAPVFAQAYSQQQQTQYQQCFTDEGREYFCNMTTRQTQWDRPKDGHVIPGQPPKFQPSVEDRTGLSGNLKPGMIFGGQVRAHLLCSASCHQQLAGQKKLLWSPCSSLAMSQL